MHVTKEPGESMAQQSRREVDGRNDLESRAANTRGCPLLAPALLGLVWTLGVTAGCAGPEGNRQEAVHGLGSEVQRLIEENHELASENATLAAEASAARKGLERQVRFGTGMRLAAQSQSLRARKPVQSLLVAVEALESTRTRGEPPIPIVHENLRGALSAVGGRPLPGHAQGVTAAVASEDGHWLVTTGRDSTARLWDLTLPEPGAAPTLLSGHEGAVTTGAFSSTGRWLVTGGADGKARLWDLKQTSLGDPAVLRGHEALISTVQFSPSGRWLATCSQDNCLRIWDLSTNDPTSTGEELSGATHDASAHVIVTADGPWLVQPSHVSPYHGGARLWRLDQGRFAYQSLTGKSVYPAAIGPHRRWLVAAIHGRDGDGEVRLYDLEADDPARTAVVMPGPKISGWLVRIAMSRRFLAVTDGDEARVWDLTAEDPQATVRVLRGHSGFIYAASLSRRGRWLVTAGNDKTARLWDLETEDPEATVRTLRGHDDAIHSVAFSPNGRWLATGGGPRDQTIRLWDLTAGDPQATVHILRGHEGHIGTLAMTADGRWLVSASPTDAVPRLWDLTAGRPGAVDVVLPAAGLSQWFGDPLLVSPNGRRLAIRGAPARIWDLSAADPERTTVDLIDRTRQPSLPSTSPPLNHDVPAAISNRWLVTSRRGSEPLLWDLSAADPSSGPRLLRGHRSPMEVSPDGRWLATASADATMHLCDLTVEDPVASVRLLGGHESPVRAIAFSAGGHWLVSGDRNGTTRVWDLSAEDPGTPVRVLGGHGAVQSMAMSADGKRLAAGGSDLTVRVWDLGALDPVARVLRLEPAEPRGGIGRVSRVSVRISPDGRWLAISAFGADRVELWDLAAEDPATRPHVLDATAPRVTVFSPDSRWLVTAENGDATLWELSVDGSKPTARALYGNSVYDAAAFSADSRWLATAGLGGMTQLWDLAGPDLPGMPVVLPGHQGSVRAVAFTADGSRLLTGSDDTTVRVWEVRLDRLMEQARRRAGRTLTEQELAANHLPAPSEGR